MYREKRDKGFSLIELIVVIAIMAILVGVLTVTLTKNIEKSKRSVCFSDMDNLCREYMINIITSKEDPHDLVESIMDEHDITSEGNDTFSGQCKSGGIYTVTYNEDNSISISCSIHGTSTIGSEEIGYYYLSALQKVYSEFFQGLSQSEKNALLRTTRIDSTGFGYTDGSIMPSFEAYLSKEGINVPATAMWKISIDKNNNMFNFYWFDDGETVTIPKPDGIGYQLQTDLDGNILGQKNDVVISFENNTKEGITYPTIANKGVHF